MKLQAAPRPPTEDDTDPKNPQFERREIEAAAQLISALLRSGRTPDILRTQPGKNFMAKIFRAKEAHRPPYKIRRKKKKRRFDCL